MNETRELPKDPAAWDNTVDGLGMEAVHEQSGRRDLLRGRTFTGKQEKERDRQPEHRRDAQEAAQIEWQRAIVTLMP